MTPSSESKPGSPVGFLVGVLVVCSCWRVVWRVVSVGGRTRVWWCGVRVVAGCFPRPRVCGFGYAKDPRERVLDRGFFVRVVRRRATLPRPVGCSTIAVPGLSFRVRNGSGRLPWAMAAANPVLSGNPWVSRWLAGWGPDGGRLSVVLRSRTVVPCRVCFAQSSLW